MKKFLFLFILPLLAIVTQAADVPEESELTSMVDSSITSFGKSIKKKDFSGFYKEIAHLWQKQTTPEQLETAFKDFLDKDIDLPAAIKDKDPVFNQKATIDSDGVLLVKGYYPTTPNRILFELKYVEEDEEWKLVGIHVNLKE
jgi:hypothetical protein